MRILGGLVLGGLGALAVLPVVQCYGAGVEERWQAITALDAGPQPVPGSVGDPRTMALAHLAKQEQALREFLAQDGKDARAFEARLRLARLLQIRGDVQGSKEAVAEAGQIMEALEKSATPAQMPEVHFAQIAMRMRLRRNRVEERQHLLTMARTFEQQHPTDRRVAVLFTEVAGLFASQPATMRALLERAAPLAKDPELQGRIADDLKRLDLLGKPLALRVPTLEKGSFELGQLRGSAVVVVFFALWSQPSLNALDTVKLAMAKCEGGLKLVAVSLDAKAAPLETMLKEKSFSGSVVGWDGLGWESPVVRSFGINALPTVWLVDKKGRLRSLDGNENLLSQARQLIAEP